jgi:hypothetical protein
MLTCRSHVSLHFTFIISTHSIFSVASLAAFGDTWTPTATAALATAVATLHGVGADTLFYMGVTTGS